MRRVFHPKKVKIVIKCIKLKIICETRLGLSEKFISTKKTKIDPERVIRQQWVAYEFIYDRQAILPLTSQNCKLHKKDYLLSV